MKSLPKLQSKSKDQFHSQFDEEKQNLKDKSLGSNKDGNQAPNLGQDNSASSFIQDPTERLAHIIGENGYFMFLVCLIGSFVKIPAGMNAFASVFIMAREDYRCQTCFENDLSLKNYTEILDQYYIKKVDDTCSNAFDLCQVNANLLSDSDTCDLNLELQPAWRPCEKWIFEHTLYESTATVDFQLVCQNRYLNTIATSIFYFGYAIGGIIGGLLADKFGRKYVSILMILGLGISDIITAFSANIQFFIVMRFMIGFFLNGMMVTAFTMCMEFISKKYRGAMGCWFCALFSIGVILVSYPLAVLVKDWRVMQKWLSCLCWPIAILWIIYVPESYKWLISKSKAQSAYKIARFCMSRNKPNFDPEDEKNLQQAIDDKVDEVKNYPNSSITNLFTNKNMLFVTLICGYNWFVCSLGFYGAGLNAGILPGSTIMNNAIMGFMELPALFFSSFIMEIKWLGRVKTSAISHISGGIVLVLSSYLLSLNDCPDQKDPPG